MNTTLFLLPLYLLVASLTANGQDKPQAGSVPILPVIERHRNPDYVEMDAEPIRWFGLGMPMSSNARVTPMASCPG